ncbi:hypothetical protein KUTeg_000808, partial [Tegillarca granosa]
LERPPAIQSKLKSRYYVSKSVVHKMFPCQADGNPKPTVYWTQNSQKFDSTELKRIYPNGTLHIVKIVTDLTKPPYKIDWGRYQPESNLGPIQWFREDSVTGMEVEIFSGGNYSIEDSERKLIFKYVNEKDEGRYVCQLKGIRNTCFLNVTSPPIFDDETKDKPQMLTLPEGEDAKDGEYTLSQRDMILSKLFEFSNGRKNVTINAENLQGSEIYQVIGVYTVVIRHKYENKTLTSEFTTDSTIEPPIPTVGPQLAAFDFWILAVVLGCLVLFVVIILIICLCYRNRGGTYPVDKKEVEAGHDPEKELKESGFHDLSRADDFDNPGYDNVSLSSLKPIESDEDSMGDYEGEIDVSKFNEDGSFIGLYAEKKKPTQSTV